MLTLSPVASVSAVLHSDYQATLSFNGATQSIAMTIAPLLRGGDGTDGSDGSDGLSAYDVAVAAGFVGDETAWLASLQGADGADGPQGPQGATGATGPAGAADTPYFFSVISNGAATQTANAWTKLSAVLADVKFNKNSPWNVANKRLLIDSNNQGYWEFGGSVVLKAVPDGTIYIALAVKNGQYATERRMLGRGITGGSSYAGASGVSYWSLTAGDYLELYCYVPVTLSLAEDVGYCTCFGKRIAPF